MLAQPAAEGFAASDVLQCLSSCAGSMHSRPAAVMQQVSPLWTPGWRSSTSRSTRRPSAPEGGSHPSGTFTLAGLQRRCAGGCVASRPHVRK